MFSLLLSALRQNVLEFQSCLKCDHTRRTVAAQADSQQTSGRRRGIAQRSKPCLRGAIAGNARRHQDRETVVRMVEDIEKLSIHSELYVFRQREKLGQVEIAPGEIRPTEGIAAQVSELAILRGVASETSAGGRVNRGYEGIRIQPLQGTGLGHAADGFVLIRRYTRHHTGKLGQVSAFTVHDSVSVC